MSSPADTLLYTGTWRDAIPRRLILDPMLHAVDKIVWQMLMTRVSPDVPSPFPTYDDITQTLNIARATAVRAIHILRLSRWISLARGTRDHETGQFRANAYILHDQPLSPFQIAESDPGYLEFLAEMVSHSHPRVALVAHVVLNQVLGSPLRFNLEPTVLQKLEAALAISTGIGLPGGDQDGDGDAVQNLNGGLNPAVQILNSAVEPRVQNLNSPDNSLKSLEISQNIPPVQFLNSDRSSSCSSSSFFKTSTTTKPVATSARTHEDADGELIWPSFLGEPERRRALATLQRHDPDTQQALLDELAAQTVAKRDSRAPIRNPLGYLSWMAQELEVGRMPLTSHGTRYAQLREREAARDAASKAREAALTQDGLALSVRGSPLAQRVAAIRKNAQGVGSDD